MVTSPHIAKDVDESLRKMQNQVVRQINQQPSSKKKAHKGGLKVGANGAHGGGHHHHHPGGGGSAGKKSPIHHLATPSNPIHGHQHQQHHNHHASLKKGAPAAKRALNFSTPTKLASRSAPSSLRKSSPTISSSPTNGCFAGSKCYEPPTAKLLPQPPTAWTSTSGQEVKNFAKGSEQGRLTSNGDEQWRASRHLMLLLNVNAAA